MNKSNILWSVRNFTLQRVLTVRVACAALLIGISLLASNVQSWAEEREKIDVTFRVNDQLQYLLPATSAVEDGNAAVPPIHAVKCRVYAEGKSSTQIDKQRKTIEIADPEVKKSDNGDNKYELGQTIGTYFSIDIDPSKIYGQGYILRNKKEFTSSNLSDIVATDFSVEVSHRRSPDDITKEETVGGWETVPISARQVNMNGTITLYSAHDQITKFTDDYFAALGISAGGIARVSIFCGKDKDPLSFKRAVCKYQNKNEKGRTIQRIYAPKWLTINSVRPTNASLLTTSKDAKKPSSQPVVEADVTLARDLTLLQFLPPNITKASQAWQFFGSGTVSTQALDPSANFQLGFTQDIAARNNGSSYHFQLDDIISESGGNDYLSTRFAWRGLLPARLMKMFEVENPKGPTTLDKLYTNEIEAGLFSALPVALDNRINKTLVKMGVSNFVFDRRTLLAGLRLRMQLSYGPDRWRGAKITGTYKMFVFPIENARGGHTPYIRTWEHYLNVVVALPGTGGKLGPGYEIGLDDTNYVKYSGRWVFSYRTTF